MRAETAPLLNTSRLCLRHLQIGDQFTILVLQDDSLLMSLAPVQRPMLALEDGTIADDADDDDAGSEKSWRGLGEPAEGDPDTYSLSFTCYGGVVYTGQT